MNSLKEFAVDAMSTEGMSVSLDEDSTQATVECREHSEGVIDSGPVHDLARRHDVDVERVLGDFDDGVLTAIVVDTAGRDAGGDS